MATHPTLATQPRSVSGKKLNALRRQGIIPGHIFGQGDSVAVQFDAHTFQRMRELHQTAGLLELHLDENARQMVIVRHIEHKPSTGQILHVDFMRIRLNEPVRAKVPLELVGESPAVKLSGGIIILLLEAVEIEALPEALPEKITIDASQLKTLDAVLHSSDLQLAAGVTLLSDPTMPIAKVQPPRTEEAATAGATSTVTATPQV